MTLNLILLNGDDEVRKYYGFDTFAGCTQEDLRYSPHLNPENWKISSMDFVWTRIQHAGLSRICNQPFQGSTFI